METNGLMLSACNFMKMSSSLAVFPGLSIHFTKPMYKLILKFPEKLFSRTHITFNCTLHSYLCHTSQPCMAWDNRTSSCIAILAIKRTPPFQQGGGVEPPTKFSKREWGDFTGPQLLGGLLGNRE